MAKVSGKRHRRAYINPLPGFPEAAQRAAILQRYDDIGEWYVESPNVTRADFMQQLRAGDEAIVARALCLADGTIRDPDLRVADLGEARGDVHAACAVLVSADDQLNSREHWLAMKAKARADLVFFRNMANASKRKHNYTDEQLRAMGQVRMDKRYTNDMQRLAAIKRKGIKVPGRTWFVQMLPLLLVQRGIEI